MNHRRYIRIFAFLAGMVILLAAAGTASAMEIEPDEYHAPSEVIGDPGGDGITAATAEPPMPKPTAQPTPEPPDYSDLWIGEYILQDEPETVLSITPGTDGKLHMEAFFYRMTGIEAEIVPNDDEAVRFSDIDGAYNGGLYRQTDGSILLGVYGGRDMGPDGVFREYFLSREFLFTKDGKRHGEEAGELLRRLTRNDLTTSPKPGETYRKAYIYTFSYEGNLDRWTRYDYDDTGYRVTERYNGNSASVDEYDAKGRHTKRTQYDGGRVESTEIYTYNDDGKLTCRHSKRYDDQGVSHSYTYYDYSADGRQAAVRSVLEDGREGVTARYEYAGDGTRIERTYYPFGDDPDAVQSETHYDSKGREIRSVYYTDGNRIYLQNDFEYVLDAEGRLTRKTTVVRGEDGHVYRTVIDFERSEDGRITSQIDFISGSTDRTISKTFRNSEGQEIYQYRMYEFNGDSPSVSVDDTEYECDASGTRQILSREYRYSSYTGRSADKISFTLYEGDQGTMIGISPLPHGGNGADYYLDIDDLNYSLRNMTRDEVVSTFHAKQVSECVYDSPDRIHLCGYTGALRFIFGGKDSNRVQSVWWACDDAPEAASGLKKTLGDEGLHWFTSGGWDKTNGLWMSMENGNLDDGGVRLISGVQGGQPLTWLCCTYSWYQQEEGFTMPWEAETYIPGHVPPAEPDDTPPATEDPAPETEAEQEPETAPEPESEPEDEPIPDDTGEPSEPETEPEPEPEPENEPTGMTEKESAAWTGYWMTGGDDQGELIITAGEDGGLRMKALFLRTFDMDAGLMPLDAAHCSYETPYGHYTGMLTREEDGTLRFEVTGGMSMEDDENELYYFFSGREYVFRAADYADLWYEAPADRPEDDADWQGTWTARSGDLTSRMQITRGVRGDYILQLSCSTGYAIAGPLEKSDSRTMDFVTDEFSAMLTLNRKNRAILMSEAGSVSDSANEWLDAAGYVIEYRAEGTASPTPAAVQPAAETEETAKPEKAPEPAAVPAQETGSPADERLIPIAGKQGYMQVPPGLVTATSYIIGKDPNAYTPDKASDGDEDTAFQFSTKESRPGDAYLYFDFDSPAEIDELWIKNGVWKKEKGRDPYQRNCRVKDMTVEFCYTGDNDYRDPVSATLKDDRERTDWTKVALGRRTDVTRIRIRIDSIYKGSKFKNDVGITEILFVKKTDGE